MPRDRRIAQRGFEVSLFAALAVLTNAASARAEIGTAPFRVNTNVAGNQALSDISMSGSGEWIAIFREEPANTNFARRYDAAGRPRLPTSFSVLGQYAAPDWFGKFMATRFAPDGSSNGIFSTLYDPLGSTLRGELRVHASTAGNQAGPGVAANANGDSVVIWMSDSKVWARRFAPDGSAVRPELLVGEGSPVGVRMDYWGNFVVAYLRVETSPLLNVWARSFTPDGAAGAEVRVTQNARRIYNGAKLGMNEVGDAVVVWDETAGGIYGQRFVLGGGRVGGEFLIANGIAPDVGMALDGSFVTVYKDGLSGGPRVIKRAYAGNGVPRGNPTVIAQSDASGQIDWAWPRIAMDRDGGYAVAWARSDTTGQKDVYAQRFLPEGIPVSSLANGSTLFSLAGANGSWLYYRLSVPTGASSLNVSISSTTGTGDADLYLRYGALPSLASWDASPYLAGSNEAIVWSSPAAGDWFIGVNAFSAYSGLTLQVSYR